MGVAYSRPCKYEKLLQQYYLNNRYSNVSCMNLCSSELSDLEKILGNTNWTFSTFFNLHSIPLCLWLFYYKPGPPTCFSLHPGLVYLSSCKIFHLITSSISISRPSSTNVLSVLCVCKYCVWIFCVIRVQWLVVLIVVGAAILRVKDTLFV